MAKIIIKGSDYLKLGYELTNIQLEYEVINNINLAREISRSYLSGKHFMYKHVTYYKTLTVNKMNYMITNNSINLPRHSMKGILFLQCETHDESGRDSKKFFNPDN